MRRPMFGIEGADGISLDVLDIEINKEVVSYYSELIAQKDFMELFNAVDTANSHCCDTYLGQALDEARKSPLFRED
jgi:hypothetical protein